MRLEGFRVRIRRTAHRVWCVPLRVFCRLRAQIKSLNYGDARRSTSGLDPILVLRRRRRKCFEQSVDMAVVVDQSR